VKEPIVLPRDQAEQALRVAREALLNARRHSQASRIQVTLSQEEEHLMLSVEDNGAGFELDSLPCDDGRPHFGVNIMYARAARLGGDLQIQSAPGAGTRVILKWPARSAGEGA
jgi:signal transduction histidine kinase